MEEQKKKIAKIEVDKNLCMGCGTCAVLAPNAFEINEDGHSSVKDTWREVDDETLINTAKSCPSMAINLYDEEENKISL